MSDLASHTRSVRAMNWAAWGSVNNALRFRQK
jgi:hypothetical protein